MLNYRVYDEARRKVLLPELHRTDYDLFFMDAMTTKEIVEKTLDKEYPYLDLPPLLDEYDKHFYVQMEPGWLVNKNQVYGAIAARRGEMNPGAVLQVGPREGETDRTWLIGEFCTTHTITDESAAAMRIVVAYLLNGLLNQKHMIIETNGKRKIQDRGKASKPRYRTIYLSDVAKRYVHSRDYQPGEGGGWKMPEHEVRGHLRVLPNGRVIKVRGHKRGDPTIERKTLPVQVRL